MSTRGSNRVVHRLDHGSNTNAKGSVHRKQDCAGTSRFFSGNCRFQPWRYLKRFGYKVGRALRWRRKGSDEGRSEAVHVAAAPDPLRSEAIKDCIQFINSSSSSASSARPDSVSATTRAT